ncbi:MAG: cob(I)yrinic acid a,c-diamide adenosyltransferase [Chloroflexi bacterium]|nr:cob(I)yrinic acid a,c-diamide adenosyltransferase [Chloroflexota bacterium]
MARESRRGLVIVYTGDGKGKTSAALGALVRAVGYGWRVCMIQFIKGSWHYGEMDGVKRLEPNVEFMQAGEGFYKIMNDKLPEAVHRQAAQHGLQLAREKIQSNAYDLIILDEINNTIQTELLTAAEVLSLIELKPKWLHLMLTGRGAPAELIERADLVTEMREIKHPYQQGLFAQKGIDF